MDETFKQTCVFTSGWDVPGRIRYFDLQGGRRVVAKLIDVDSADYQWTADDTGQRDLTWKIIDEVELIEKSMITLDVTVRMKSGKIINISTFEAITNPRRMMRLSDFIEREYPSKYKEGFIPLFV
ncbi:MAG TPA: hypothetical protein VNW97_05000 [Candidatus Saccharimonadales bacterium]|jgi:hypothetical protein|nr:hypothetical protein [Candidatus Saccharimonadales bacterium]